MIGSWRAICGFLADVWHWQPSELYELEVSELAEWFEMAQSINDEKAAALRSS